ncbi:DEAD/DEAH box helicase [Candidatus Woesearchaeota archaeon]|nr:DEAD/DEAH box helicase [Candidatus Woesearchaeota archaeon]
MISHKTNPDDSKEIKDLLNPIVRKWFFTKFKEFSIPQLYGVTEVHSRNNILLSAPTGTGKTLTAFLSILNELVDSSEKGILQDKVYAIYVSPLKALSRDISVNLLEPLEEMQRIAEKKFGIRVAVRTGDTTATEKRKMLESPPHILITTPESLAIMLCSIKFSEHIKGVEWAIVDEIHSLAENKRGVHLSLVLEQLQRFSPGMCRVGLSACLDYNTYVTLANGEIIKIGDFVDNIFLGKNIEHFQGMEYVTVENQKILSINKEGKIVPSKILKAWRIPQKNNLVEVVLQTGKKVSITTNDKFMTLINGKLIWKDVSTFKINDFIAIPKSIPIKGEKKRVLDYISDSKEIFIKNPSDLIKIITDEEITKKSINIKQLASELNINYNKLLKLREKNNISISLPLFNKIINLSNKKQTIKINSFCGSTTKYFVKLPEYVNEDFMRLFGLIASDGHVSYGIVSFANKNPELISEVSNLMYSLFGRKPSIRKHSNAQEKNLIVTLKSIPVSILFNKLGLNFGNKIRTMQIHKEITSYPKEYIAAFISGFLDGDGCISYNKNCNGAYFRLHSSSKDFIEQMYHCFVVLGVHPSMLCSKRETGLLYYLEVNSSKDRKKLFNILKYSGKSIKLKEKLSNQERTSFYPIGDLLNNYKNKYKLSFDKLNKLLKVYTPDIIYRGYCSEQILKIIILNLKNSSPLINLRPKLEVILNSDISFEKINSINPIKCSCNYVYDFSIKDNPNFIASNILVHNTVSPLDEVSKFLVGSIRKCKVIDVQFLKQSDLQVLSPVDDFVSNSYEKIDKATYELLDKQIQEHKTTLIFTNTRAGTERVVHHLKTIFPEKYSVIDEDSKEVRSLIGAHHGSLSKEMRLQMERNLRDGKMRCLVCSTSLELGIDIGSIDLVLCLGSPKSVARALQRQGRSGHHLHGITKGRIIVTDRDDLVECSVLLKNAIEKNMDRIHIPTNCLDVLAQQIFGMALEEIWSYDDLFETIKKSYCYSKLTKKDFDEVLDYLAGNFTSLEDRHIYARIWWDKEKNQIGKRGKMSRIIYMTNLGTIPDQQGIIVKDNKGNKIGMIDEMFLEKLDKGDIFVLGGNTYQFSYARGMVASVVPMPNKKPTVPSWYSDRLPLSYDLAKSICNFRLLMEEKFKRKVSKIEIIKFINEYLYVHSETSEAIYNYFKDQYDYIGLPTSKKIIIESYRDEQMKNYVIFHTLYGRRVNDVLSRAVAFAISRSQHKDVEIGISDNGFYVVFDRNVNVQKAFSLLKSSELKKVLDLAIDKSEILKRRFRHCAGRSFMILRTYGGVRRHTGRQQVSSTILLSAVKRISENFFIIKETRREILEDLMDYDSALEVLKEIEDKRIKIEEIQTFIPSPFALNLVMQGFSDILKMEDKQQFLQRMHQMVKAKIALKNR